MKTKLINIMLMFLLVVPMVSASITTIVSPPNSDYSVSGIYTFEATSLPDAVISHLTFSFNDIILCTDTLIENRNASCDADTTGIVDGRYTDFIATTYNSKGDVLDSSSSWIINFDNTPTVVNESNSSFGVNNVKNIVFAGFGLIAVALLAAIAFLLTKMFNGDVDMASLSAISIMGIGLTIVIFVGYLIINAVSQGTI